MFADVDVVMVPKVSTELATTQLLLQLYGPYLGQRFQLVAKSDYWHAYRRRGRSEAAGRNRDPAESQGAPG
jgi:hypothetical protein